MQGMPMHTKQEYVRPHLQPAAQLVRLQEVEVARRQEPVAQLLCLHALRVVTYEPAPLPRVAAQQLQEAVHAQDEVRHLQHCRACS